MHASADPIGLLLQQHIELEDLFARHQEALLERRWEEATRLLEEYCGYLRCHIELEEQYLLPHCAHIETPRWPIEVYRAEHRRIEQLLRKAAQRLDRGRRGHGTARTIISLLDRERTIKDLIEHHHERERQGLFEELRADLPAEVRAAFVRDVAVCELH